MGRLRQVKLKTTSMLFSDFSFIFKKSVNWVLFMPSTEQIIMLQYSLLPLMFFTLIHAQGDVSANVVPPDTV